MSFLLLSCASLLVPPPVLVPSAPAIHAMTKLEHNRNIFPSQDLPSANLVSATDTDSSIAAPTVEEDGKTRGRLIFAAIVCNSLFWQYLYPTLRGEENALGKMLSRGAEQRRR